jgi:hypothetical protein
MDTETETLKKQLTAATTTKPLIQADEIITTVNGMPLTKLAQETAATNGGSPTQAQIVAAKELHSEITQIQTKHKAAISDLTGQMQKDIELQLQARKAAKNIQQSIESRKLIIDMVTKEYAPKFTALHNEHSEAIKTQLEKHSTILAEAKKVEENLKNATKACDTAVLNALQTAKKNAFDELLKLDITHRSEASAAYLVDKDLAHKIPSGPKSNTAKTDVEPAIQIDTGRLETAHAILTTSGNTTYCHFKKNIWGNYHISVDDIRAQLLRHRATSDNPKITITVNVGAHGYKSNQKVADQLARAYYKEARALGYTDDQITIASSKPDLNFTTQNYKQPSRWGRFKDHFRDSFDEKIAKHENAQEEDTQSILNDINNNFFPIMKLGETLAANCSTLNADMATLDTADAAAFKESLETIGTVSKDITLQIDKIGDLAKQFEKPEDSAQESGAHQDRAAALQEELNTARDALKVTQESIAKAKDNPLASKAQIKDLEEAYKKQKIAIDIVDNKLSPHLPDKTLSAKVDDDQAPRAHNIRSMG